MIKTEDEARIMATAVRCKGIHARKNTILVVLVHLTTVLLFGPCQANLVLIAYASSEGSGEPAHPHSLARTSAARSYKQ